MHSIKKIMYDFFKVYIFKVISHYLACKFRFFTWFALNVIRICKKTMIYTEFNTLNNSHKKSIQCDIDFVFTILCTIMDSNYK